MSVKIMAKVWEMNLPPNEKFVLLALADHADHEGNNAYPGQGTLAFKTGYDARNVRRILQSLERQKVIIKTHKGHGKDNPDCYSIRTNKADILSGNKADILSGNKADILSANDENNADKSDKQSGHIVQTMRTNRAIPPDPPIRRTVHEPLVNQHTHRGAANGSKKPVCGFASRFDRKICEEYAESLQQAGVGIRNPKGLAVSIQRSGSEDEAIQTWLDSNKKPKGMYDDLFAKYSNK